MQKRLLSNWQVVLFSVGSMIGGGWLFAPYFTFHSAGIIGGLSAWIITTVIALIIALSFAETISILPVSGAMTRFMKVTHGNTVTFLMIACGWISYIVLVPLEAQATTRYLSFWFPSLTVVVQNGVELTWYGTMLAFALIIGLTWLNTLVITKVAKTNSFATVWKMLIPSGLVLFIIIMYGHMSNLNFNMANHPFVLKDVFGSISKDGLAFSLLGFQNGLLLSKQCKDPKKGVVYSLFIPLFLACFIYMGLSLTFAYVQNSGTHANQAIAPLLGLVFSLGLQWLTIILFVDAVISPLGTGNVYITFSGRIMYGVACEYFPKSRLAKLNPNDQPAYCLWLNAFVACLFLLPFPTWRKLANFFASIVALMYLAGPITLIVLRQKAAEIQRSFRVKFYGVVGYLGFIGCSMLIFWSGLQNIQYLTILLIILFVLFLLFKGRENSVRDAVSGGLLVFHCLILWMIALFSNNGVLLFPYDSVMIVVLSVIVCYVFTLLSLTKVEIGQNIQTITTNEADTL